MRQNIKVGSIRSAEESELREARTSRCEVTYEQANLRSGRGTNLIHTYNGLMSLPE